MYKSKKTAKRLSFCYDRRDQFRCISVINRRFGHFGEKQTYILDAVRHLQTCRIDASLFRQTGIYRYRIITFSKTRCHCIRNLFFCPPEMSRRGNLRGSIQYISNYFFCRQRLLYSMYNGQNEMYS